MKKIQIFLLVATASTIFLYKTFATKTTPTYTKEAAVTNTIAQEQTILANAIKVDAPIQNPDFIKKLEKKKIPNAANAYDKIRIKINPNIKSNKEAMFDIITNPNIAKFFITNSAKFGFIGKDNYMIEYYIKTAERDTTEQARILVTGYIRFKNNITPICGYYKINKACTNVEQNNNIELCSRYSVSGEFVFDEKNSNGKHIASYSGTWVSDISIVNNPNKELECYYGYNTISDNNGLLLYGTKQLVNDIERKQDFCFSYSIENIGSDIFNVFYFGDRDVSINQQYADKGWNEMYTNEEWWEMKKETH